MVLVAVVLAAAVSETLLLRQPLALPARLHANECVLAYECLDIFIYVYTYQNI